MGCAEPIDAVGLPVGVDVTVALDCAFVTVPALTPDIPPDGGTEGGEDFCSFLTNSSGPQLQLQCRISQLQVVTLQY